MTRPWLTKVALLMAMLALMLAPCFAEEILQFTGGSYTPSVNNQTIGWSFTVNSGLQVTDLSWYDPTGLNQRTRPVGIWDSNHQLVVSACVGAPCGSIWIGGFWITPVSTFLSVGDYVIGGYVYADGSDSFVLGDPTITTDPSITYLESRFTVSDAFVEPTSTCCGQGFFGPDFSIGTNVPEPASISLIGLGLGLGGLWKRLIS
jgi:hypothetical protein